MYKYATPPSHNLPKSQMAVGDNNSPASYIHLVQHLIEKCLLFGMSMEECMEALSKHANVKPVITSTVWKELEKENKEFFETYGRQRERGVGVNAETLAASLGCNFKL